MSGKCLQGVWNFPEKCLKAVWNVTGSFTGGCLEVLIFSSSILYSFMVEEGTKTGLEKYLELPVSMSLSLDIQEISQSQ